MVVAGTFEDRAAACEAVKRLRAAGVPAGDLSLIVREGEVATPPLPEAGVRGGAVAAPNRPLPGAEPVVRRRLDEDEVEPEVIDNASAAATGTASGALIGGITGFIAGLATLAIPGLGPVLAAGPLAATLGGTVLGAAGGGLVGALVDAGVSRAQAERYNFEIDEGRVLITVRTNGVSTPRVRRILADAGALSLYPEVD